MRYLVTGGTGFIGQHLVNALVRRGDKVVALVRSPEKAKRLPSTGVELLEGDLGMFADPALVLPEVDVVVHLAGIVTASDPADYERINFTAVGDLLECLARQTWQPRRMLFASSLAAAGPSPVGRPWTEEDEPQPADPYGEAKARAEKVVAAAPFPTTSFRPPLVFGPGDEPTLSMFRAARAGVGMQIAGTPQVLSFVDVRDLVSAIVCMAQDEREGHFTYFTSHPEAMDVGRLWRALSIAVGRKRPALVIPMPRVGLWAAMRVATAVTGVLGVFNQLDDKQYRQMIAPEFVCSSAALRGELGWRPRFVLEDCLVHAAEGYRAAGQLRL